MPIAIVKCRCGSHYVNIIGCRLCFRRQQFLRLLIERRVQLSQRNLVKWLLEEMR